MQDLQEITDEIHYENYRSDKLQLKKFLANDEKQKKLIQEKDKEVRYSFLLISSLSFLCSSFDECKRC